MSYDDIEKTPSNFDSEGIYINPDDIKPSIDLPPDELDRWEEEIPISTNRNDFDNTVDSTLLESSDFAFWDEPETKEEKQEKKKLKKEIEKKDYVISKRYFICNPDKVTEKECDEYYKEKIEEHKASLRKKGYEGKECKVFFSYKIPIMNTLMDVSIWKEGENLYYISTIADGGLNIDTKYFGVVVDNGIAGEFNDVRPSNADLVYKITKKDKEKKAFTTILPKWLEYFSEKGINGEIEASFRRNYKFAYGYGIREDQLKLMPFPLVVFYFGYLKFVDQTIPKEKKENLFFRALNS